MSISNGFANLCVKENEVTSCPVGICKNYCYKFQCTELCPHHTFNFNSTCLERCPKEANFITTGDCEENCFSAEKTCHKECPEPYNYHLNTPFFTWCQRKCPIYTHVNNFTCELSCSNNGLYLYNNTCRRTCPDSHRLVYLHSSKFNEILMCTNHCVNLVLYQNRCTTKCPKQTILHNGSCLSSCPTTHPYIYSTALRYRTDVSLNQSDLVCVRDCGLEYKTLNFTCVVECPIPFFAHGGLCKNECTGDKMYHIQHFRKCISSCPLSFFLFNNTKICYGNCPKDFLYTFNQTCYSECPETAQFVIEKEKGAFYYNGILYQSGLYYECVEKCPYLYFQNKCVTTCPATAKYQFNKTCVRNCSGDMPYHLTKRELFYLEKYYCVAVCPVYVVKQSSICTSTCPVDALYLYNKTCDSMCPFSQKFAMKKMSFYECVAGCPKLSVNNLCVEKCPDMAKYQAGPVCLNMCYGSLSYHYTNTTKTRLSYFSYTTETNYYCLETCPKNMFGFYFRCVTECPKTTYHLQEKCVYDCPYPFQYVIATELRCTDVCPNNTVLYNRTCMSFCPDKMLQLQNTCVRKCPQTHLIYTQNNYTGQIRNFCVSICPNSSYKLQSEKLCLDKCPQQFYIDGRECVETCPRYRKLINNNTKECTARCHDMYLYFNVCVEICPTEAFVYRNICVIKCPLSHSLKYFANGDTPSKKYCVHKCPTHAYQMDDSCYDVCPNSLLLYEQHCVKTCPPSRKLVDVTTNRCNAKCPKDLVITFHNKCDKRCPAENQFIENGSCVQSCPTHSRHYYSTSNGYLCTNSCAGQYIAFEETKICKTKCPNNRVIVDGVCKLHEKCTNHPFIKDTPKGRVCGHGCPEGKKLYGTKCIWSCPHDLYVFNKTCVQECPKHAPYLWKAFGATIPRECFSFCPFMMVVNGSDCISIIECVGIMLEKDYAIHNGMCVKECPSRMLRFKNSSCQYISEFVVPIVICFFITVGCFITIIKMMSLKIKAKKTMESSQVGI